MVPDMTGYSCNQTVDVMLRKLRACLVRSLEVFGVLMKEVSVGISRGVALAILFGIAALLRSRPI